MSKAQSTGARLSFSHRQSLPSGNLHKPLSLLHQRAVRRSNNNHNPTAAKKKKSHYRKLIRMKKQKVMSQMKGQDKTPERQLNEVEIGNVPKKELRIMIVKIQDLGKKFGDKF